MDDNDELERLNRLLDDLAAERDPRDRADLTAAEAALAETAAWLKAADRAKARPRAAFLDRLDAQIAAADTRPPAPEATPGADAGLSRRGLLGRLVAGASGLAIGAGAASAALGSAMGAAYARGKRDGYREEVDEPFATPLVPQDRGQWLDTGHTLTGLAAGQAVRFHVGALEGFVVNPGQGQPVYALSAACTHMGCLLTWLGATGTFLCPCHGAQYRLDGSVHSGIARHPLPRLHVRVDPAGRLLIWGVTVHPAVTTPLPYTEP